MLPCTLFYPIPRVSVVSDSQDRRAYIYIYIYTYTYHVYIYIYSDGHTLRNGFGNFLLAPRTFFVSKCCPQQVLLFLSVDPDCYNPIQHLEMVFNT